MNFFKKLLSTVRGFVFDKELAILGYILALSVITRVILQFMVLRNALGFGFREHPSFFLYTSV